VVKGLSPLTWINDGPVREGTLNAGDRLIVGPVEFQVREPFPSELPADPAPDSRASPGPPGVDLLLQEARAREALQESLRATERELDRLTRLPAAAPAAPPETQPARAPRPQTPAAPRPQTLRATPTTTERPESPAAKPALPATAAKASPQPPHPAHARVDERRAHLSGIAQSLHRRESELQRQSDDLRQGQERLEDAVARCRHWESELEQRAVDLAGRTARLDAERRGLAQTANELERQRDALQGQAAAIGRREVDLAAHREGAARELGRLTTLQEQLVAQHSALSARQQELESREAQLQGRTQDHGSDLADLEALRKELDYERARWVGERAPLEEMRARLAEERAILEGERAVLNHRQQTLQREHRELESMRRVISREREDLEQARASLALERTALQSQRTTVEAGDARGAPVTQAVELTPPLRRARDESDVTLVPEVESSPSGEPPHLAAPLPRATWTVDPVGAAFEPDLDVPHCEPAPPLDTAGPAADIVEFLTQTLPRLEPQVADSSGMREDVFVDPTGDEAAPVTGEPTEPLATDEQAEHLLEPTEEPAPASAVLKLRSQLAELFGFSSGEMRLAAADRDAASDAVPAEESSSGVLVDAAASGTDRDPGNGGSPGDAQPAEPLVADEMNQGDTASPAAAAEAPQAPHEDSVASYMEQLLSRTRAESAARPGAAPVAPAPPAPPGVPAAGPAAQSAGDDVSQADSARRRAARSLPPEEREAMRANLDSFRELANISARTAVAKHASNKLKIGVQVKGVLALTSVVLAVLMVLADLTGPVSYQPYALATFGLALVMVIDFVRTMLSYSRWKGVENSVNWEAEPPPVGTAHDQEATEHVPDVPADPAIETVPQQVAEARL
jgi:hypothetical protein